MFNPCKRGPFSKRSGGITRLATGNLLPSQKKISPRKTTSLFDSY